jgi:energy-coupling factor transport system substrate-specific component
VRRRLSSLAGAAAGARSVGLLVLVSGVGLAGLCWPFFVSAHSATSTAHAGDAPWVLLAMVPLLLALCASELARGQLDARAIAVLGILAACGTALRIPSPGVAGLEPVFFLLVLAGRVYGPSFGFALGGLTLFISGLVTGGVGPWLPFQMLAAGWVGAGVALVPPVRGAVERWLLAGYAAIACILYGAVMNLWFWPFGAGTTTTVSYVPGAGLGVNLVHFIVFDVTTSLGFDVPRAVLNAVLIIAVGGPILAALRRSARRTVHLESWEVAPGPGPVPLSSGTPRSDLEGPA